MGNQTLRNCASRCLGEASMFTHGKCLAGEDCYCECEKDSRGDRTCDEMNAGGFILYVYTPPGMFT